MSACVIVVGGEPPDPAVRRELPAEALVIAADSGLDHAEALGLAPGLVIGDLDSVSGDALARARKAGTPVEEHATAKDETDLELALGAALAAGATELVVVSGGGGRLDHLLAAVAALVEPGADDPAVSVTAWLGPAHLAVLHGPGTLVVQGRPGELLTLLAAGGPAHGVRTAGLRYPLSDETLLAFSSRGVSNEFESETASVSLTHGHLVVIRPEALEVPA